ncbi:MAG: hypothetical protein E7668_05535 [Ruminococcaceae bacterium]|nr:hypothetical protein [Oscillospiraceae bacterium]
MFSKALARVLPGKVLMFIQNIVCLLLILVMCVMSFGTIFTVRIELSDGMQGTLDEIIRVATPEGSEASLVIPEKIDVSLPYIVQSTGKIIGSAKNLMTLWNDVQELQRSANSLKDRKDELDSTASDLNSAKEEGLAGAEGVQNELTNVQNEMDGVQKDLDEVEAKLEKVKNDLRSMITQELVSVLALAFTLVSCFGSNMLLALSYIFLLCMVVTIPLTAVIQTLIALISFFSRVTRPERAFHRVARSFAGIFGLLPLILIVKLLVPSVQLGYGVWGVLACVVAGLVISLMAARLKYYEKSDFKYLNVLQIVSACSVGGFLLFFFTMLKSGVVGGIVERFGTYQASTSTMKYLTWGMIALFFVTLVMTFDYMIHVFTRFACMSKSRSDKHIVLASIHMLTAILPMVLMLTEFGLALTGRALVYFILASVGLVLMLAAEIVQTVLDKTMCGEVSKERKRAIVTGGYVYVEEQGAEAEEAPAEAAPEEVPAAELPASEDAVEELPAEEISEEAVEETAEESVAEPSSADEGLEESSEEKAPVEEENTL